MIYWAHIDYQVILSFATLLLIAEAVSAEVVEVKGIVGGSVRLNCSCSNRKPNTNISWQLGETILVLVSETGNDKPKIGVNYTGRVERTSTKDCSILISNVTVADEGTYKCNFQKPSYDYEQFNLRVSASYHVCMKQVSEETPEVSRGGAQMFQCQASGGYPKSKIQWYLNEKPFHNGSRTDRIKKDNSTGLNHLSSNLTIEMNVSWPAEWKITCGIETSGLSNSDSCSDKSSSTSLNTQNKQPTEVVTVTVLVCVVVLLVVLALVVWLKRRKHSCIKKGSRTYFL